MQSPELDPTVLAASRLAWEKGQADTANALASERLAFEREKVATEQRQRQEEIALKEQELRRGRWVNPLFLAVVAATLGLIGNAYIARINNSDTRVLEDVKNRHAVERDSQKAQTDRLLEFLKPVAHDKPEENLRLLLKSSLYTDNGELAAFLDRGPPKDDPNIKDIKFDFQARSNGDVTFRKCISSPPNYHFADWAVTKTVIGDGNAWFEKQTTTELCIRADASVTADGRNSGVDAVLTAKQVPN
jgi:hypothetical protein